MARYPNKATYRTWVRDSKTGEWKQIDPKDIPQDKINELCDNFALGAGYTRAKQPLRWLVGQAGRRQMKVGNVLMAIGFGVFLISACALDSDGLAGMIMFWLTLGGLWIMWLGYVINDINKRHKKTNRRSESLRKSA